MRGFEELQSAVFHVRDVTAYEFELEAIAMVRPAKQDGLLFKLQTLFAILQNFRNNILGFRITILDRNVLRFAAIRTIRKEILPILPLAFRDQAVGTIEYGLRRAIVLFKRYDPR